ncbi:hypothetical protein CTEN210_00384 [Chaetoceros tenuissimus]|uniref:Fatty acid hydroxylase domain-containing protein n=1 Tax=Chaetoceros tenuissimus TaxID=426638 RepID=A0AAD3GYS2_9STRA|nr:hypothetical protein CTEN210_00384 [Chaetoceros tenuissimus]
MSLIDYEQIFVWGCLPLMAAALGFFFTHFFVRVLEIMKVLTPQHFIIYKHSKESRESLRDKVFAKISKKEQFVSNVLSLIGPAQWFIGLIAGILLSHIFSSSTADDLATEKSFSNLNSQRTMAQVMFKLIMLHLLDDFFLYWGHRIQHEIPYMWKKWHSQHHQLQTPTTYATAYVHDLDSTLQAGIPMIMATILVKPSSIAFTIYCFIRLSENTINHSGYDHPLINVLWWKWFPLRAPIGHHDSHHRYSNHGKSAKNYAEFYIIWDWVFGTYRKAGTS